MTAIELTPAQRKQFRALAHHLDPVVMVGADGLSATVMKEVDQALNVHGLIKVRVFNDDRDARSALLTELANAHGAAPIQHIGKLLVLWREPVVRVKPVDENRGAGPKEVKIVKFSRSGNHRPQVKRVRVLGNQRVTEGGSVKRAKKRNPTTSSKKRAQQT